MVVPPVAGERGYQVPVEVVRAVGLGDGGACGGEVGARVGGQAAVAGLPVAGQDRGVGETFERGDRGQPDLDLGGWRQVFEYGHETSSSRVVSGAAAAAAVTEAASVMSSWTGMTPVLVSRVPGLRAPPWTPAPRLVNWSARCFPSPRLAPETNAVVFGRSLLLLPGLLVRGTLICCKGQFRVSGAIEPCGS